ncbi:hypothetical protein [Rhizobium bangladeshense]|uniref:hypothetical protein n=1 Tax=Rhizobium bangladeshense TaxID=1138189 RepID=UPI001C82C605|nr:hypothetical protein [Rhizobium bangladeshense]MBX4898867.1 hypothetical protein [Rhizobium bangladeshense]MBY3616963.1 hypothetical protein [Rhizobium bangladeshense]
MTKRSTSSSVVKSAKAPASGSYKLAGKPTHFTSKEIKATVQQLRRGFPAEVAERQAAK